LNTNIHNNEIPENNTQEAYERNTRLRCIKCPECGEEILLLPTLKLMTTAIENHVNTHRMQTKTEMGLGPKPLCIGNDLTEQVLFHASQQVEFDNKPSLWIRP